MRLFLGIVALSALTAASVVAINMHADACSAAERGCDDGCAGEQQARAEHEQRARAEHEQDACGDSPCPCDREDGDCPPNCHDCACSGIATSTVGPSGTTSIGCAPETALLAEPPLERRASGVASRVFRPPRG